MLRCPECAGCLTLRAFDETSEVEEGILTCDFCDRRFPIINAIPRLLPDVHIHVVVRYQADFFRRRKIDPDLIISRSSKAARDNTRHLSNVHLVQGDIFRPPLAPAAFDFVYSIGVLHHLPEPKTGFLTLTRLLKSDAPIFIWVYLRRRGRQIAAFSLMRAISTRMPLRLLDVVCLAIATGQWLAWIVPYRILSRFRATQRFARYIPFTLYARYPFRTLHTDWFDGLSVPLVNYYRREQVEAWYREAGLERVRIDENWGGRALGYKPSAIQR